VVDEAAQVAGVILAECRAAVILATSREPLGVAGERRFVLGPLSVSSRPHTFHVEVVSVFDRN
jgi:predicted ATPase